MVMKHRNVVLVCCHLLCMVPFLPALAQDTAHFITLPREKLLTFEGIFTNTRNSDQSWQFTAGTNSLNARPLWTDDTSILSPDSELVFSMKGRGDRFSVRFVKDQDGKINQLILNNQDVYRRNLNYHPFLFKEVGHTPAQLKPYEGFFTQDGLYIRFFEKENRLILREYWYDEVGPFVPDTSWDFYLRNNRLFSLHFIKDVHGKVTQVLEFKQIRWDKVRAAHYTADDLKTFEGKYYLVTDKDDVVQIITSGPGLIVKQLWDGKSTTVSPMAELFFYNPAESFPVGFIRNSGGKIIEFKGPHENRYIKIP
jgi:hypothetical protein